MPPSTRRRVSPFDAAQKTFEWKTKPGPYKVAVANSFVSNDWRAGAWLIMLTLQSTLSVAQIAQGGKDIILGLLILGTIVAYGRRDVARA